MNYCDLNLYPYEGTFRAKKALEMMRAAHKLGYCAGAINYNTCPPLRQKDVRRTSKACAHAIRGKKRVLQASVVSLQPFT